MTREDWDPHRRPRGSAYISVLLFIVGAAQVFIGYAATSGAVFVFAGGGYWYRADNVGWGWVNLAVGLAAVVIGLGRFRRARSGCPASISASADSAAYSGGEYAGADRGRFGRVRLGRRDQFERLRRRATPALVVAAVSAMSQIFLAPQYPIFATLVITVDVLLVWALATTSRPGGAGGPDRITR